MVKSFIFLCLIFANIMSFASEKILIIGDSLTEGYGIEQEFSYPAVLEALLKKKGHQYDVINGGVSGSTTSSGLTRLKWFLKSKPKIMILALGANDGLRGIELKKSKKNLEDIIVKAKQLSIQVVLAGMQLPPNYGKEYTGQFKQMYLDLVSKHKVHFIPFLIKGVAGKPELNIEDGIHPNVEGHIIIANTVYESIKELL